MHFSRRAEHVFALAIALGGWLLGGAGCATGTGAEAAGRVGPRSARVVHGLPEATVARPPAKDATLTPAGTSPVATPGLPDLPIRMPGGLGPEVQMEPYLVEKTKLAPYIIQNIAWTRSATLVPPGANVAAGSFTMMLVADKTAMTRVQGLVLWVEPGPQSMQVARIGDRPITELRSDEALRLLRESGEPVQVTVHLRGGATRTIDCYLRPRR